MQPPGLAQVEAAQADGRWAQAYDGARASTVPDDLQAALAAKPETRARRIAQLVAMLARGDTIHPPSKARTA